jgi:ankyrin repeat protein
MKFFVMLCTLALLLYGVCSSDIKMDEKLDDIKRFHYIDDQPPECVILYHHFPLMMENTCGHAICGLCFENICDLAENKKCPICREPYTNKFEDYKIIVYQLPKTIKSLDNTDLKKELKIENSEWSNPEILEKIQITANQWMENDLNGTNMQNLLNLQKFLPFVCQLGKIEIVKTWMDLGLDANLPGIFGYYPMNLCSKRDIIEYLENEKNADMSLKRKDEMSGFEFSCSFGYLEIVQYWLEKGVDVDVVMGELNYTPLYRSCGEGHLKVASLLVSHGADIETPALDGTTPLCAGVMTDHFNVVQFLVEKGAIVNHKALGGQTPLHLSSFFGRVETMKFLLSNGADATILDDKLSTPLFLSAEEGHFYKVKCLLENEKALTTINQINIYGITPLLISAQKGFIEIVKLLVDHGAKLYQQDFSGFTAKTIAIKEQQLEVVKYLMEVMKGQHGHHFCAVCEEIAFKRCSGCKNIWYCGRTHQSDDWKTHKLNCNIKKTKN